MNNVCGRTKADSSSPATVLPILLIQIIDNVCQRLDICNLANLVRTNSILNVVGKRWLYHTIGVEMRPARLLQCMIFTWPQCRFAISCEDVSRHWWLNSLNIICRPGHTDSYNLTMYFAEPAFQSYCQLSSRARGLPCLEIQTIIFRLRAPQQLADPEW